MFMVNNYIFVIYKLIEKYFKDIFHITNEKLNEVKI